MKTKLTLTLDKEVIQEAKAYAKDHRQSLSKIVENYFKDITKKEKNTYNLDENELSPIVKKLRGSIPLDEDIDYKEVLIEELQKKYGI